MKNRFLSLGILFTVLLSGCGKPHHSEQWYESHAEERAADVAACQANPNYSPAQNCINAEQAQSRADMLADAARALAAAKAEDNQK